MPKSTTIWIFIAIAAVLVIGMLFQKNYGLFAGTGECISEEATDTYSQAYIGGGQLAAQDFEPSLTGTIDSITIKLRKNTGTYPINVEIRNTIDGIAIWSYSIPSSAIPTSAGEVVLSSLLNPPTLTVGIPYYLFLSTTDSSLQAYSWTYGGSDNYPAGQRHTKTSSSWTNVANDFYFKVNICEAVACTESWTCSAWTPSTCTSGTQTRTCTDANACGTTANKPATTQTCSTTCPTFQQLIDYANSWASC